MGAAWRWRRHMQHAPSQVYLPSLSDTFGVVYCGSGPENGHETALELVSGANFGCVLHHLRARPVGTGLGAKFGRKPIKNPMQIMIFITYTTRR